MRSVILSDLDMTLTRESLMNALVGHHIERGLVPPIVQKKELAIRKDYERGRIGYEQASYEALAVWAGCLVQKNFSDLVADAKDFFSINLGIFHPYFKILRQEYRLTHDFYLVTANFDFVAQAVCEIFGLTGYAATKIGKTAGICSSTVCCSLLSASSKKKSAQDILSGYDRERSIGLGDTENDAQMLGSVAFPVCVNASPGLRALAVRHGWTLAAPSEVLNAVAVVK